MAQLQFSGVVKTLFFDMSLENTRPDEILKDLYNNPHLEAPKAISEVFSLSTNMALDATGKAKKTTFVCKMLQSPLSEIKMESGYIKLGIGEAGRIKKIIDLELCFEYNEQKDAEDVFNKLIDIFSPLSTLEVVDREEVYPLSKHAVFSTRKKDNKGIQDVTILFGKPDLADKYEIVILPFNEFGSCDFLK